MHVCRMHVTLAGLLSAGTTRAGSADQATSVAFRNGGAGGDGGDGEGLGRWPPIQVPFFGGPHIPTPSLARPIQQMPERRESGTPSDGKHQSASVSYAQPLGIQWALQRRVLGGTERQDAREMVKDDFEVVELPSEVSSCQVSHPMSAQHALAQASVDLSPVDACCRPWHCTPLALTGNEAAPEQLPLATPSSPSPRPPWTATRVATDHSVLWNSPRA